MRTSLILATLLGLGLASGARARLGESPEECTARYGLRLNAPQQVKGFWPLEQQFDKNGIRLVIRYLNEDGSGLKAGCIQYKPGDPRESPLSAVQTHALLSNVATNWTVWRWKETPVPVTNEAPEITKTMLRTSHTRMVTLEQTGGIEADRKKKAREAYQAEVQAVQAANRELDEFKVILGKLMVPGTNYWSCSAAVAAGDATSLTILSRDFVKAYNRNEANERHRKEKAAATPLRGF